MDDNNPMPWDPILDGQMSVYTLIGGHEAQQTNVDVHRRVIVGITIQAITADNFIQAIRLRVNKEQENYVASNAFSIAQSKFHTFLQCVGIYADDEMVGFSAFGKNPEDETIWIVRHMIAEQYQGKGYGKKGLQVLIDQMQQECNCEEIYLDVSPENHVAINLYQNAGFKDTGRIQGHSRVLALSLE